MLDEYDGPRLFTVKDAEGELNLAYWSDEDDQGCHYVVVPTTPTIVGSLQKGLITIFDALNQPRCWRCVLTTQGELSACWRVDFEDIPRDALPAVGTMLYPHLEPQLIDLEGRIRELDKDRLSFELREIPGPVPVQRFVFDEELLDEVFQTFQDDVRVQVTGRTFPVKNFAYVLALSRVTAAEP